jgi:hypothetical protein
VECQKSNTDNEGQYLISTATFSNEINQYFHVEDDDIIYEESFEKIFEMRRTTLLLTKKK